MMRNALHVGLAALATGLLAACSSGSDKMMATETMAETPAMIAVSDQTPNGQNVTIAEVMSPVDGFLVIHEVIDGKPQAPQSIGHTAVKKGDNKDVTVALTTAPAAGSTLLAMLHNDTGQIGVYEFGPGATTEDLPLMENGQPVVKPFKTM